MSLGPRVAIVGVWLESNRSAPVASERDFRSLFWVEGDDILAACRSPQPVVLREAAAFVAAMDATGPWCPVPVLLAGCHPQGPIDGALLGRMLEQIDDGLRRAGPLDAVYIANHGGMIATDDDDPDGRMLELIRAAAGAESRVVATLDLHANISERMVDCVDLIVGYRTNPHVDYIERGEEAAFALRLMLAGAASPRSAFIRLPLTPATTTLLTETGPYADMIDLGQRRRAELAGAILNVSVFGGFVFSDSAKNGVAVVVTARDDVAKARALAREIAVAGWGFRDRFVKVLTPLDEALRIALDRDREPVIFSDSGDNPGGGGTGRTTELVSALVWSGAEDVLIGSFFDPPLAEAAHTVGVGATFRAEFNSHLGLPCDAPFVAEAKVIGLSDGNVIGRLGWAQGRAMRLGPCAALKIGGVVAVVISDRAQTADPVFFEMFGLDIGAAHTVAVKSRGHFRAGFRPWFPSERVIEVDTEGLTSPVLSRRQWHRLPRPVFPLDEDAAWTPPDW